jgi:two-component system KDP operon response regulator KdpE
MRKILVIDDDQTLREMFSDHLRMLGYETVTAADGSTGLRLATEQPFDLVVLDVMMPGMDGWAVCEELRKTSRTPIIMLTAKSDEIDKLRGFRLGVDDYVTKPFSFAELAARIGAVLNRTTSTPMAQAVVTSGNLTISFDQQRVTVDGNPIDLTPTEYRLLETLARQANHTIPAEQLVMVVWGSAYAGEVEQVKHYIWTLRKKIEADPGDPRHVLTERGFGYRFE